MVISAYDPIYLGGATLAYNVSNPSAFAFGYSDKLRGNPPALRPKARSWPLSRPKAERCFSLDAFGFTGGASPPNPMPELTQAASAVFGARQRFQLVQAQPTVCTKFTSYHQGPRFLCRLKPTVPAREI